MSTYTMLHLDPLIARHIRIGRYLQLAVASIGDAARVEDLMTDAACEAIELSDAGFDLIHELCPVCDGAENVMVDGKPDVCPSCQGERSVSHTRADAIRVDMQEADTKPDSDRHTVSVVREGG